ncbi:MAG: DUF934 domain-containing protein [Nevskia sp.]
MSQLIRNGHIVADDYMLLADDAALPASGKLIVSLERWRRERESLLASGLAVGVKLPNTADIATVWPEIADRPLIELDFPGFADGRAYSQGRLLSERYQFTSTLGGELRATGKVVVRDQFQFLVRCGFNSFELREGQDPAACLAAVREFTVQYQQAADAVTPIFVQRRRSGQ